MKIVTGYTGTPHVTSNAAQAFNQGIFGNGNCVLDVGYKFSATLTDANTVTISDGEGVMQGVHFRIDPGTTEAVTISNGTSGYKRIDLICARYTKNAVTGVEDVSLVVVEGTPDASTPTAPTVNSGTILTGDSPVDFPLWQVSLDSLTPSLTSLIATLVVTSGSELPTAILKEFDSIISGVTPTTGECYYYKLGSTVVIHFSAKGMSGGTTYSICRMPEGYRPYKDTYFTAPWVDLYAMVCVTSYGWFQIRPIGSQNSSNKVEFEIRYDIFDT